MVLGAAALVGACIDWRELEGGRCGDGFVGPEEACDDGNRIGGDGCSETCLREPPICGNGRTEADEKCDDGNDDDTDDCVEGCVEAKCGDGFLHEFVEQCDEGDLTDGDGCDRNCRLEGSGPLPTCGNGKLDPNEACDDGNASDGDSCLTGCSWATCGDGRLRAGVEECDYGAPDAAANCTQGCLSCGGEDDQYYRGGNAHCYSVHNDAVTEQEARRACQMEGGDLWTLTSELESNDVIAKLALDGRYWLGLLTTKSGSSWVSGESTNFTSFAAGEPSAPELRCVALDTVTGAGSWSSQACSLKLGYVCERSPAVIAPMDRHAYRIHTAALAQDAAREGCRAGGGQLASLETDAQRQFVGKNAGIAAWLAARLDTPGRFVWPDGAVVDPAEFAPGQPDGHGTEQQCLLLNPGKKFADAPCDEPHAFICEFD